MLNNGKLEQVHIFSDEARSSKLDMNQSSNRGSPADKMIFSGKRSILDYYDDQSSKENQYTRFNKN